MDYFVCPQLSADRWWSIHRPFTYRVHQSKSKATLVLSLTWATTLLLHVPLTGLYDVITARLFSCSQTAVGTLGGLLGNVGSPSGVLLVAEQRGQPQVYSTCTSTAVQRALTCDLPYKHDVAVVVAVTVLRYLIPFLLMLMLNLTLYSKIRERKRVQVRRSISGMDTVLFSLLKASSSDSECNHNHDDLRTQRTERRLSRLSPAPLNRRHTMSQILFPGMGYSPNPTFASSPRQARPLRRRVSLQDCLQSSGYSSTLQVPRRKSHGLTQSLSDSLLPVSRRQSREDLAKDLLVKQDKKAACFLALLQVVSTDLLVRPSFCLRLSLSACLSLFFVYLPACLAVYVSSLSLSMKNGVPHGPVLGPLLMYISDLSLIKSSYTQHDT